MPLAALALASCSNDEVQSQAVKQSTDAVTFLPAMNNVTRGTIYTDAGFSSTPGAFNVIAKGLFYTTEPDPATPIAPTTMEKSSTVSFTAATASWDLASKLWWGDGTTAAKFTAYAGLDGTISGGTGGTLTHSASSTVSDMKDLVVAYNEGSRGDFSSGVPLHFRHTLSQIIVNASYADDASQDINKFPSLTVKVKAVRFSNITLNGTLTLPTASTAAGETYTPAWTPSTGLTQLKSTDNEVTLGSAVTDILSADGPMLMIPQTQVAAATLVSTPSTGAYIEVLANIVKGTDPVYPASAADATNPGYDWIAVPVAISWDGGYKYTYTLNFSNVACGKISPNATDIPAGKSKGDDVISGVPHLVTFLVTVEDTWADGGTTTPAL